MKWIGQHIYDYVANFRNTVIIDSVSISAVQTSAESFADNDTSLMTSAAIDDRINTAVTAEDLDLTTDSGTIAIDLDSETLTIAGGEGIDTSATSNTVTITGEEASTSNKGVASFASANFSVSSGAVSIKSGGVDLTDEVTGTLPVGNGGTGATSLTDNSILTGTGSSAITAEANLTYDGNDLTAASSTSGKPIITIKNTTDDAAGSFLKFVKDKGNTGADGDDIGTIEFISDNTEQQQTSFAKILVEVSESLDTDETGKLTFYVASSDGNTSSLTAGLILEGELQGASGGTEVDVTIGYDAASTTTIAGTLTMGSTSFVNNSGVVQVATQGTIDHDSLANFVANEHIDWTASSAGTIHSSNYTDTNTNQLTTFTLTGDSGVNQTVAHGNTLDIAGGNAISTVVGATDTVTVNHDDTSSQASVNNSGNAFIQDVTLDTYGHVTGLTTASVGTTIASAEAPGIASFPEADFTIDEEGIVSITRKAYFTFRGYGTADGTNYEAPEILSDQNSPFEHDTSYGSDGLTAQEPRQFIKSGAIVMPYAGVLKRWTGWAASAGSGTIDMSLFKATLTRNSTTNVTPVLLKNTQFTALGNTKLEDFAETSFSVTFSAGDVIYTAVKGSTNNKLWYLDSTLEIEWT